MRLGFRQSNFQRQAKSWAETLEAKINWYVTQPTDQHLWVPQYIRTFELDADGKPMESVRIFFTEKPLQRYHNGIWAVNLSGGGVDLLQIRLMEAKTQFGT